jgi:glucan phosphorylase
MNNPLSVEKLENKVRYKNVTVIPVGNEKFPTMVMIDKAPAKIKDIKGKKFINPIKAQLAIESALAEQLIKKGAGRVKAELDSVGILVEPSAW